MVVSHVGRRTKHREMDRRRRQSYSISLTAVCVEGMVRQLLVDDKGMVLIAVWGLPPFSHDDDAVRGMILLLLRVCVECMYALRAYACICAWIRLS